jgi:hypothetical protein
MAQIGTNLWHATACIVVNHSKTDKCYCILYDKTLNFIVHKLYFGHPHSSFKPRLHYAQFLVRHG